MRRVRQTASTVVAPIRREPSRRHPCCPHRNRVVGQARGRAPATGVTRKGYRQQQQQAHPSSSLRGVSQPWSQVKLGGSSRQHVHPHQTPVMLLSKPGEGEWRTDIASPWEGAAVPLRGVDRSEGGPDPQPACNNGAIAYRSTVDGGATNVSAIAPPALAATSIDRFSDSCSAPISRPAPTNTSRTMTRKRSVGSSSSSNRTNVARQADHCGMEGELTDGLHATTEMLSNMTKEGGRATLSRSRYGIAWRLGEVPLTTLPPGVTRLAKVDGMFGASKEGGPLSRSLTTKGIGKRDVEPLRSRGGASPSPSSTPPSPGGADTPGIGGSGGKGVVNGAGAGGGDGATDGGSGGGGVVGDLPHQVSELYADMERKLMARMHAQDKNRFRAVGLSSLLLLIWVLSMFGTEIRRYFASQTAEVARETLKVEALQVQTQELATALVQALLNDQEVVSAGALFLREASSNPETQAALVSLALYVLRHPDTLAETRVLAKKLVRAVLDDPDTVRQVTDLALNVIRTPRFRKGASELVVALGQSEEVYGAVTALAARVIQDPEVQATLSTVLSASSREVLQNQEIFDHSKDFVAQVMGDDAVQRSGGDALWNTVQYALQTRLFKATGLCILAAGSAVLLSGRGSGRDVGGSR